MHKLCLFLMLMLTSTVAPAIVLPPFSPLTTLNQVSFQVSSEQWVITKNAKVTIAVNATLNEAKLANTYTNINQKLQKIVDNVAWHITTFERSQDKSGLEQLFVTAETRLTDAQLASLRARLQSISTPGETYSIASIDYTPTLAEKEIAQSTLRSDIYQKIKTELAQLNATYPHQKFTVHTITFNEANEIPAPRAMMFARDASAKQSTNNSPLAVSNKLQLNARVVLASTLDSGPLNDK